MVNDLISRQAAIDALIELSVQRDEWESKEGFAQKRGIDAAICAIEDLPSAERWIPVAERRPEAYGRYLVTLEYEGYRSVMPLYYGRINRIDTFYDSDSEYGDIEYCGAIAWMPLPEPYKGGEQNE